ncbi:MAG: ribosomal L7Ae/L30e/S12e/Gadd45 family protein [Proteocatella sp.]
MKNKIKTMLGFAKKAGKITSGEGITLENIKKGRVKLVLLASDASDNTSKRIKDKASYRNIQVIESLDRYEMGKAMGIEERVVVGITDRGFADSIKKIVGGEQYGKDTNTQTS